MVEYKFIPVNSLKEGNIIEIEGFYCKIQSIEKSKPGKHGAAKARIVGIDVFTDKKYTLLTSASDEAKSPLLKRANAQVVAIMGDNIQIMDLASYETFETPMPTDSEVANAVTNGCEVEYLRDEAKVRILRVK